ncbi:MAG: PocR ligand-binding domain-containing protein, partial [bacterium]
MASREMETKRFWEGQEFEDLHLSICLSEEVRPAVSVPHSARKEIFCDLIQQSLEGLNRCLKSDKKGLQIACGNKRPYIYQCHAGLVEGVIPLIFMDKCVAFIMFGQFLTQEPSEEKFSQIVEKIRGLPVDIEELRRAYYELPVVSPKFVHDFAWAIFELVNHIKSSLLQMLRQGKMDYKKMKELYLRKAENDFKK